MPSGPDLEIGKLGMAQGGRWGLHNQGSPHISWRNIRYMLLGVSKPCDNPRMRSNVMFSVCMSVFCNTLTFESLDRESRPCVTRHWHWLSSVHSWRPCYSGRAYETLPQCLTVLKLLRTAERKQNNLLTYIHTHILTYWLIIHSDCHS